MRTEQWKPIKGWEDLYEISDLGRVKRLAGFWCRKDRLIKPTVNKVPGRDNLFVVTVDLFHKHKMRRYRLSRLVLLTFVGPPKDPTALARHINDNPLDNRLTNLKWGTHAENSNDAIRNGRIKPLRGERNPGAKLNRYDVRAIRASTATRAELAADYGVTVSCIVGIIKRKTWRHL